MSTSQLKMLMPTQKETHGGLSPELQFYGVTLIMFVGVFSAASLALNVSP